MNRINTLQLYSILLTMTTPLAFLVIPKTLTVCLENNAWLAPLATVIPGILIIYMHSSIIRKSRRPFPLMLEEHLGKIVGKTLGFLYILFFLLTSSYVLRVFVEFIESNVLPGTPISVFIGVMLLISLAAIKSGLTNIARMSELIIYVAVPFTIVMLSLSLMHNPDFGNLRPLFHMSPKGFTLALIFATVPLLNLIPILTLFYYYPQKNVFKPMLIVMLSYIFFISFMVISTVVVLGGQNANLFTFPSFVAIRMIRLGDFIQNIDIVFIGVWIMGIFGVLSMWWFMACYTIQKVFNLHDYRFLAAPTSLIVGVTAIFIAPNILELGLLIRKILVPTYYFFLFFIPLILFLVTLFKAPIKSQPEYPNSNETVFKAE